jgi:hypothetical protein
MQLWSGPTSQLLGPRLELLGETMVQLDQQAHGAARDPVRDERDQGQKLL